MVEITYLGSTSRCGGIPLRVVARSARERTVRWMIHAWLLAACGIQVVGCLAVWRFLKKLRCGFEDEAKQLRAGVAEVLVEVGDDVRRLRAEVVANNEWVSALEEELRAQHTTREGARLDDVRLDLIGMMNNLNEDTRQDFLAQRRDEHLDNYLRELWNSRDNLRVFIHPEHPQYRRPPLAPGAPPLNWYVMAANLEEIDPETQEVRLVNREQVRFRALLYHTQAHLE